MTRVLYTDYSGCLKSRDKEIFDLLREEEIRQNDGIELIASENYTAPEVLEAVGSVAMWKYAEGYPGKRYYGGCRYIDAIENLAIERLKKVFNAEYVNVQPHSGTEANLAAYAAFLKPGDKVMAMGLNFGGHLSHITNLSLSSQLYQSVFYGVGADGHLNMNEIREIAIKEKPQMILAGASAYPFIIDFKAFREIADEVGAYLMVDMAHICGLVAGGVHPSPIPYADVVTSTTHKTARGPRGAIIIAKKEYEKQINSAVFPKIQGGSLENVIAGKAVMAKLMLDDSFKEYAQNVVNNAKILANELKNNGIKLVGDGTENHLMLLDLSETEFTGKQIENLLGEANITVNKNMIPFDTKKPTQTSGIRLGTPAVTTRGMGKQEMQLIGKFISGIIKKELKPENIVDSVNELCDMYPIYKGGAPEIE